MDKFFRSFLEMKWKIKGEWVSFLDALLFVAITGSGLIMRLALMWGLTGWFWPVDYVVAAAAAVYVRRGTGSLRKSLGAYSFFVIMPTLMMASAYWGQADSFYVALVMLSFACLGAGCFPLAKASGRKAVSDAASRTTLAAHSGKSGLMLAAAILFGLAILMNVQAIFVLPVFVVLWLLGSFPTVPLLVAFAAMIGRLLLGKNGQQLLFGNGSLAAADRILREYDAAQAMRQAGQSAVQMSQSISQSGQSAVQMSQNISPSVQALTHTAPLSDSWANVYQFLRTEDFAREFFIGGIAFTAAILLVIFLWFFVKLEQPTGTIKTKLTRRELSGIWLSGQEFVTELAMFFALLMPFVLPHMNARCGLLADCFAVMLLFFNKKKSYFALVQLITSFSMMQNVLAGAVPMPLAVYAAAELVLICLAGMDLYRGVRQWTTVSENI